MSNEIKRNILLLVEGRSEEVKLFNRILKCFPEIDICSDNILVYDTNLWVLNGDLVKEFGDDWYLQEIDFLGFLKSSNKVKRQIASIDSAKITDIFLIFDYERQDPLFDAETLEEILRFFNNSTENGQLYISYPMIESYKHFCVKPLPDIDYLNRLCNCNVLTSSENKKNKYKQIVGIESRYTDLRKIEAEDFRQFVIHNLCKASHITQGTKGISEEIAHSYWDSLDMLNILKCQNRYSKDLLNGFVSVICTCLFFIPEYNSKLIFNVNN